MKGAMSRTRLCPCWWTCPWFSPAGVAFPSPYPIKPGDEALVVFSSRCIDGWWQGGRGRAPAGQPDARPLRRACHSGPRPQAGKLDPSVDPENVQLRTDDGKASLTIKPDTTLDMRNEQGSVVISPAGEITLEASLSLTITAPQVIIEGNPTTTGSGSGDGVVSMRGAVSLEGGLTATGDMTAEGKSVAHHTHPGDSGGTTGEPT